jgi:predicted HicB family RNase H-like nuclease
MEEFVASPAGTASLMASLIDRAAARVRVDHALALTPVATPIEAAPADAPLFCEKGRASVSPLAPVAAAPARRPRLWLRLSAAEHRRIKLAAAFLGQSTAAFLRDALAVFMDNLLPLATTPRIVARPLQQPSRERRVKLAFCVDAAAHAALHNVAAQRGNSVQALLTTAIDVHLARLVDSPVAKNLRPLLEAFDAVTAARAAGPGAEVIDFPMRRRVVAPAPPARRHAAR